MAVFYLKYNHPTKLYLTENLSSCRDVAQAGFKNGIFNITVPGKQEKVQVYCDIDTDKADWLVSFVSFLPYCQSNIKIKMKIKA